MTSPQGDFLNLSSSLSVHKIMLSLPPKVSGRVNGHLVMKIDEVIWSQKPKDDVLAVVMWWGGETATTFRPVNVARYAAVEDTTDVVYEIRTSLLLFEKYLRKCGTLRIVVTDTKGAPIGIVRIPEVHNIIQVSPYENYFPIVTSLETRIGDLHVVFQLIKLKQPCPTSLNEKSASLNKKGNDSVIRDDSQSKPLHTFCDSKLENATAPPVNGAICRSRNMAVRGSCRGRSRDMRRLSTSKRDNGRTVVSDPEKSHDKSETYSTNRKQLSCDDLDEIFSQILERGQRLQKAITLSVIEDEMSGTVFSDPVALMHSCCDSGVAQQNEHSKRCTGKTVTEGLEVSSKVDCSKDKHISAEDKNKVICYLQGKTMTAKEESEALDILRGMSPTEGFLHELKDYCMKPLHERNKMLSSESLFTDDSSQDDLTTQKSLLKTYVKPAGWLPLHRVNCVRLSIIKLILNSVGLKRVTASIPSKGKSEILFNDYAIHAVSSLSEQDATNVLVTLLSKLVFRVCARQLNQRAPIVLGEASLTAISELLSSASLSNEFLAPVVASDGIFVASLNVRVELGKDRIHFGGPSLSSARNVVRKASDDSDYSNTCGTGGDGPSAANSITRKKHIPRDSRLHATSSDEIESSLRQFPPKEPKDVQRKTQSTQPKFPNSVSQQTVNPNFAPAQMDSKLVPNNKFGYVNHDLAITVQRISDCQVVAGISPQNVHKIIAYRFPSWDATKLTAIEWQLFSTDPAMCKQDLHFFGANRVHSSLLPGSETFYSFLRDTLQARGADPNDGIEFVLFFRSYYPKVCDTPTAMAHLPLDTISTLEAAFVDAATNNPNFTESSCASVIMDLPLQRIRNNLVLANEPAIGILHLKLDYRHAFVRPIQREGSGDSQLDPFIEENLIFDKKMHSEDALPHPLKHPWSLPPNIQTVNTVHVPNIAVAIHNISKIAENYPCPVWLDADDKGQDGTETGGNARSRRIETVFVTDPSDNFSHEYENSGKQASKSRRCKRHREKQSESSVSDNDVSLPPKSVAHAGTRTEVMTCTEHSEAFSVSVQTSPIRGSVDLSVEIDDAKVPSFRPEPRKPVESCDASTWTNTPLRNDQELQTNLPVQATGCQTSESLVNLAISSEEKRDSKVEDSRSTSLAPILSCSKVVSMEAVGQTRQSVAETIPSTEGEFDEATFVEMRDSIQTAATRDYSKTGSERFSVEVQQPPTEKSPRVSECERNLLSRRQTVESTKRRTVTGVKSQRSTWDKQLTEPDKVVASGDKPPVAATQTRVIRSETVSSIPARIEVECALHLPECEHPGENSLTFVTVHTDREESGQEILRTVEQLITPHVPSGSDVQWNWSCQIDLPAALFIEEERRLIFKVWQRRGKSNLTEVLGIAAVDLTVLTAGLPLIDGWFNILDLSGNSQGQIKVSVAPRSETCSLLLPRQTSLEKKSPRSLEPVSYYVAQGMFKKFPAHLTNHDDILVQKVQNILGLCDAFGLESLKHLEPNASAGLSEDVVFAPRDTLRDKAAKPHQLAGQKETIALLKYLEQADENNAASNDDAKEIAANFRETLTELDRLTLKMKERICIAESHAAEIHSKTHGKDTSGKDTVSFGAVPKQKSPLRSKSGCSQRPPTAQERVNAWECESTENIYACDSPRRSRKPPERKPSDAGPRSRPYGRFPQYSTSARPLWEHDGEEDDESVPVTGVENEGISDWITDAALREMMNMRLFFQDIVVVPKVASYNPRNEVKLVEIDDSNEAKFSDSEDAPAGSDENGSTPINSEERTASAAENPNENDGERWRSPGNEADSGVDVDQSSTLSRRNKSTSVNGRQRLAGEQRMGVQQRVDELRMSEQQWMSGQQSFDEELRFTIPQMQGQRANSDQPLNSEEQGCSELIKGQLSTIT